METLETKTGSGQRITKAEKELVAEKSQTYVLPTT